MKELKFEWYVLNERDGKIIPYNIFNNIKVIKYTNELCVKYKKDKMSFDDFVKELDKIIKWQEWGRCEYEIMVSGLFNEDKAVKIDCYQQAAPNIRIIAKYVLEEYYPQLKIKLDVQRRIY